MSANSIHYKSPVAISFGPKQSDFVYNSQSKWPALYGARTEIWYRQRHLVVVTSPTGFGRVKAGLGNPAIRKYANDSNTQKYPGIISPAGAKRRDLFRALL